MKKLWLVVALALSVPVAMTGCKSKKKKEGGAEGGGGGGGAEGGGGGGGGGGATKLDALGLTIELAAGANVGKAPMGEGVMITGGAVGAMTVEVAGESSPKTLDAAKEDASMYTPLNIKEETLPDGWALSFENKGGAGTNYWVSVRREIGGKAYACQTTASTTEQQTAVLAACKSLKP